MVVDPTQSTTVLPNGVDRPDGETNLDFELGPNGFPFNIRGYEIGPIIGAGAMATVYRARRLTDNKLVALKLLAERPDSIGTTRRRFRNEAEAASRLNHRNVVRLLDFGESDGRLFAIMELVDGPDLRKWFDRHFPASPEQVARIAYEVALAVNHAHSRGVVHRDVKPANILIGSDGTARLADFGLAKLDDQCGAHSQTGTGAIVGSPSFMAPEQARGDVRNVGRSADIYGIGGVLYWLMTGRPPIAGGNVPDVIRHVVENDPLPPRSIQPDVDPRLETICLKCLQKSPRDRYSTAMELAEDLLKVAEGSDVKVARAGMLKRAAVELGRVEHPEDYQPWATALIWIAIATLVSELSICATLELSWPSQTIPVVRMAQLSVVLLILMVTHAVRRTSRSAGSKHVACVAASYLFACSVLAISHAVEVGAVRPAQYAEWSALAGITLLALGSTHWGGFYAAGALFLVIAAATPALGTWAPLVFGSTWHVTLLAAAYQLKVGSISPRLN